MLRAPEHSKRATCCPIALKKRDNIEAMPEACADESKQAREAVAPAAEVSEVSHQQVGEQGRPYLPLDGILVVANKIVELNRLLQLLKEHHDLPASAIQLGNSPCAPVEVVRNKLHYDFLTVDLDQGFN